MVSRSQPADVWTHRAVAILYGVVCHTLFTIGVATMIAAMFYGMSRSLGRVAPPWSLVANAGLLLQFPLGHSLLLSGGGAESSAGLRLGRWLAGCPPPPT